MLCSATLVSAPAPGDDASFFFVPTNEWLSERGMTVERDVLAAFVGFVALPMSSPPPSFAILLGRSSGFIGGSCQCCWLRPNSDSRKARNLSRGDAIMRYPLSRPLVIFSCMLMSALDKTATNCPHHTMASWSVSIHTPGSAVVHTCSARPAGARPCNDERSARTTWSREPL